MEKHEENYLTMVTGVVDSLRNQSFVELLPAVHAILDEVESISGKIDRKNLLVRDGTRGLVEEKRNARELMMSSVLVIANVGAVYAREIGDVDIAHDCTTNIWKLRLMRDTEVSSICSGIVDMVWSYREDLGDYGITEDSLVEARGVIENYVKKMGEKESHAAMCVGARMDMTGLFRRLRDVIRKRLDPMMEYYRLDYPDLFYQYKAARRIRDL